MEVEKNRKFWENFVNIKIYASEIKQNEKGP